MSPLLPDRNVKHLIAMFYLIFWQRQDYNKHNNNKVWLLEKKVNQAMLMVYMNNVLMY